MPLNLIIGIGCVIAALVLIIIYMIFGKHRPGFTFDIGGAAPKASGGSDASPEGNFTSRFIGLGVAAGAALTALIARLWSMQLVSSDYWAEQAESNRTRTVTTLAPRGRILDRNGEELAGNRPSLCVTASADVLNDAIELQLLAHILGMPQQAVRRKIQDTTEGAQSKRTVAVDVSRRIVAYVYAHAALFPGVEIEQRTQRYYPKGSMAAHVIGYTGTVTADQLSKASTNGLTYQSGDIVGQTGIEYQYESVLQGIRGEQQVYVDKMGNVLEYSTSIDAQSGSDVMLTIDAGIQAVAEASLADKINYQRQRGYGATDGGVVVLDCTNGEILAMASYPTYSPSMFVGGIASSDWDNLTSEGSNYPMLNRVLAGLYPSGSVAKPFTSFAALEHGVATSSTSWNCKGWWTGFGEAYGKWCWLHSGHGPIDLAGGITNSCDTVFYEIAKSFWNSSDQEAIQESFRNYGWGTATGIDLPGEQAGRVPDAAWKWQYFANATEDQRRWQGGDTANLAIGQGDLLITILQLATSYCGIANGGPIYRPHLLKSVMAPNGGGSVIDYKVEQMLAPEESQAHRDTVIAGMKGVLYNEFESIWRHWNNLSVECAGKTGTAEVADKSKNVGGFAVFGPVEQPKYVVASMIYDVSGGDASAMLVTRDILGHIYNEPNDKNPTGTVIA